MNEQQEREAFEAAIRDLDGSGSYLGRCCEGYDDHATSRAWSMWKARSALAANEKVPSRATDIATALALPGCERLKEWAEIGPVQRAAVEEFAYALAANVPAGFLETARRIVQEYANKNPKWPMWNNGESEPTIQDPHGAHAWLEQAAMLAAAPACTCPSGDGSLRWPCPKHPAQAAERCQHAGQCHPGFCPCQASREKPTPTAPPPVPNTQPGA